MNRYKVLLAAASLLTVAGPAYAQRVDGARPGNSSRASARAPEVEVWIDRYVFRSGERIRTFFESEPGAYVTILRITTLGDVTILYPRRPTAQHAYRDELINDEIPTAGRREFYLNEPEGVGFVFAIASFEPFDYRGFTSGGQWSTMRLAGFAYGDAYRAVDSFVSRTLPSRADYSTDYIQYEVLSGSGYDRYGYAYGNAYYNNHYFRCLNHYGLNAVNYCHSYAGSGIDGYPFIVLRPPARPNPSTKPVRRPTMPPPGKVIPDPGVVAEKDGSDGASSAEASSSSRYTDVRGRTTSPGTSDDGNLRIERRQRPKPEREDQPYIIAPRSHEPAPAQRFDPPPTQRNEPAATPRYEPPPAQRYEPPRVEQRPEPVATPRYEPPPAPRYEPPRVEQRQEPRVEPRQEPRVEPRQEPREHPTPVPPPPPPPAQ